MLFNSWVFVAFALAVLGGYAACQGARKVRAQNLLLLGASYVFYGYWDWRFCGLLLLSTAVDFVVGLRLAEARRPGARRLLLLASLTVNLSALGLFKYFDFFSASAARLLRALGMEADPITLGVILPVGISFYTFQTLSYTIDVFRGRLAPTRSAVDFALFVSFFPQLMAGPIERAARLLPQIASPRVVSAGQVEAGVFLILWGYFKKVVVADNLAVLADAVFDGYVDHRGLDLLLGVLAFAGQIYGDFSGYSDIARGLAKLMGFELMVNFRLPYFATDPSDFWRRWHISLSTWLRDYLYIPLGGNRGGRLSTYRNLTITMLLGGLWHGASWNFVLWGAYHGAILVAYRLLAGPRRRAAARCPRVLRLALAMGLMFGLTLVGWVLFRGRSVGQIAHFLTMVGPSVSARTWAYASLLAAYGAPLLAVQVWQQATGDLLAPLGLPARLRALLYAFLVVGVAVWGARESPEFIYFQF